MTDLVTFGEVMLRLSPPFGERLERTRRLDVHPGGAEANVAVAAAQLGADVAWASKVPETALGRRAVDGVRRFGVDPLVAWTDEGRQGLYFAERAGRPRGTNVIYDRADAAVTTTTPDELPLDRIADASACFTSGITPALSTTLAETVADFLERASLAVFDLNYRAKLWAPAHAGEGYTALLPAVDVLFAAARDARATLDLTGEALDIAGRLRSRFDIELVVVTQGADGAVAVGPDGSLAQPAFEAETVDAIGSGDAFAGGFLARYLRDGSVEQALAYGAATAALKRTVVGDVAIVTEAEVESVIAAGEAGIRR